MAVVAGGVIVSVQLPLAHRHSGRLLSVLLL